MGCVLAAPDIVDGSARVGVAVAFLVGYTLVRTVIPVDPAPGLRRLVELVVEAGAIGLAVAATGYFSSPIAFSVLTAVSAAGFLAGFGMALRLAGATALAIGIPSITTGDVFEDDVRLVAQWAVELFLVAIVAAYARRISGEADERHSLAVDRMTRLADANDLLYSLNTVAQDLPASLDLEEVLDSTLRRLRDLLTFDTAAILVLEQSDGSWSLVRRYGVRLPSSFHPRDLPPPLVRAADSPTAVAVPNVLRAGGPGLAPKAISGLYTGLWARGALVGVLALERSEFAPFTDRDGELLAGFAEPAALALDNAQWFARLRTVGADEERTRIARDLHDRIGQSLAYLAFELDRIVRKNDQGQPVSAELTGIREDVRGVVREVRDTLYDLRTDVSEEHTVPEVLHEFLGRVRDRSGMDVHLHIDETARMPRMQERELWRIAQEAVVNAERHSEAARLDVFWHSDGREALVEVRDDGRGLPVGTVGRLDSYGMLGMRERATSIGAALTVDSVPDEGVTVRVSLRTDSD